MIRPAHPSGIKISAFRNVNSICVEHLTLNQFCDLVKNEKASFVKLIIQARAALDKGNKIKYDLIKKSLPGVTFSGIFKQRKQEKIERYTQLVVLDFDDLSIKGINTQEARRLASKVPTTCVCFASPSDDGLKIVVRVAGQVNHHPLVIRSLMSYYESQLGIKIDDSGTDTSRLCFLSYDPDIYTNFDSVIFYPSMDVKSRIANARSIVDRRLKLPLCGRNNYVYALSCITNKYGILEHEIKTYCCEYFAEHDFLENEIGKVVHSAYLNTKEHNTWSHYIPKLAEANSPFTKEQLKTARESIGVNDFLNDHQIVAQILLHDLDRRSGDEQNLAHNFASDIHPWKKYLAKTGCEHLIHEIIKNPKDGLDGVIGSRQPRGKFCALLHFLLVEEVPAALSHTAKTIILWEYTLSIIRRAFESELSLSANVSKNQLKKHVSILRTMEDKYEVIQDNVRLAYELAGIKDGVE